MGNDAKRTPGKWVINPDDPYEIIDENGDVMAWVDNEPAENEALMAMSRARARHIVQACNAHDALVAACRALVVQLRFRTPGSYEGVRINSVAELRMAHEAALAAIAPATEAADD